jgi:thioredoxin-dependent peroxiredoxin
MGRTCTLKGNSLALEGPELKVGDTAPDAVVRTNLVTDGKLADGFGKARIYSVVPSIDTPVCAEQSRRFYKEVANLQNVDFYTISFDLPVAQARFCGAEGIDTSKFKMLSDAKHADFGKKYGTYIPDHRINSRAVFVVGADNKIKYAEYVPEVANHPNYEAVVAVAKEIAK